MRGYAVAFRAQTSGWDRLAMTEGDPPQGRAANAVEAGQYFTVRGCNDCHTPN